jgi:transposase
MRFLEYVWYMQSLLDKLSKDELIQLVLEQGGRHEKVQSEYNQVQSEYSQVQSEYKKVQSEYEKAQTEVTRLTFMVKKLQGMLFGSKRERFENDAHADQLNLPFEELEAKNENTTDSPVKETITYSRDKNKNHKGRNRIPDDLPVHEIRIEPLEDTTDLVKIGEERTEILEMAPAKFFKLVIVRPKYALPNGEGIVCGNIPSRPIDKCLAGNVLLAFILISKYVDHLPLYRQQQIFKRYGIHIAPSTIDGWIAQLGTLLEPLYNAMVNVVKKDGYIQVDETPTRVLDKTKKGKCHRGYYWVYHSPPKKMVVFDYQPGRGKNAPRNMLEDFKGYLQTDGYQVYTQYGNKNDVTHLACWAHARRYFFEAKDQDKDRAEYALARIQKLYAIEREAESMTSEARKELRLEKSLPVINELGKWIAEENKKVLPKSLIGKAFAYAINLWDQLQNFLKSGELLIDNNLIENSIRPNALGRKNYLFAGSHEGAQRTAMFYTFTGTCKMQGVEPMAWLTAVLGKIADHPVNKLFELFPGNIDIPEKLTSFGELENQAV